MIRNYFKTAFRSLWRNKSFAIINIAGLAAGMAVCMAIFIIVRFELSFDNFHSKKNRVYRILTPLPTPDGMHITQGVPFPLPVTMHNDFPGIASSGVFELDNGQILITDQSGKQVEKKFKEESGTFYVEPSFFKIFDFPLLAGDYNSLKDPNTILLTKETAERYFGDWQSAVGKTFILNGNSFYGNNDNVYKVTGILAPVPKNSDFQIKLAASYYTLKNFTESTDWASVASDHCCFVLLPEKTSPASFDARLRSFTLKYKKGDLARQVEYLQPLSQVHYDETTGNFSGTTISKKLINMLCLIAGFILVIACVNFVNLSTAQAVNRAKEVGVRKVLGSSRAHLQFQFLGETAIIALCSTILAIAITALSLPFLKSLLALPISLNIIHDPLILLFLLAIIILVTVLAGFYPAVVLSRFNPITAFKSKFTAGSSKGISLRRVLVVFQFVIAQALIIGTFIIMRQMNYFRNRSMGFDKNAIVNVAFPEDSASRKKLDYLKIQLLGIHGIKSVSFSNSSPADNGNWRSNFRFDHAQKETNWNAILKWADADYLKTYSIPLVAGRDIYPGDTVSEFLVSENLVKRLGFSSPRDVLNRNLSMWDDQLSGPIVGVVKDFNARSLRYAIEPVIIATLKDFYAKAGIKLETEQSPEVMKNVARLWNRVYPDFVYEPKFLDAKIEKFYSQENKLSGLYKIFALLAVFLGCLGLYGLASFMVTQKTKEVGIRKVLGASINNIISLFSKEFLLLVGIAFLIATPIASYFMHKWLQDFVYRTAISWWIVLCAGALVTMVALAAISVKAVKAALANPVKSLRTE